MSDLNNDLDVFFICVGVVMLVTQISVAFGTFLSAATPSTKAALSLAGPLLTPLMVFSGMSERQLSGQDL